MKRRACHLELKFGYEGELSLADVRANGTVAPLPAFDGIAIQPERSAFAVIRRDGTDIPCREQLVAHAINVILASGG